MAKKKPKSVERVKIRKPKTADIAQHASNADNANQQVVQVIFPSDVELRKVKKKKKGKSPSQKKRDELLEQLKASLQSYDQLQDEAQKLNIKIPSEIGLTVINQADLKTNSDIENYIADVQQKTEALRQLIEKENQVNPFSIASKPLSRMGAGVSGGLILPQLPPAMIPQQPAQPMPMPMPMPTPTPTPARDTTKERLDAVAKALQDRLNKSGTATPAPPTGGSVTPVAPVVPDPSQPSPLPAQLPAAQGLGLENYKLNLGGVDTVVAAPPNFLDEYNRYTMYTRAVEREALKGRLTETTYHIPLQEFRRLVDSRNQEQARFSTYLSNLTPEQRAYLDDSANVNIHEVVSNMKLNLSDAISPADLAKVLFKESGIKFTEITQGNQQPAITIRIASAGDKPFKEESQNTEYAKYQSVYTSVLTKLQQLNTEIDTVKEPNKDQKFADLGKKLNRRYADITNAYDALSPIVKAAVMVENDKMLARFNPIRQKLVDNTPQVNPFTPAPLVPAAPAAPPAKPVPVPQGLTAAESRAFKIVRDYVKNSKSGVNTHYKQKQQDAVAVIFGAAKAQEIKNFQARQGQTKGFRQRMEIQMLFDQNLPDKYKPRGQRRPVP